MTSRHLLAAIEGEFTRYKALAEGAMRQVSDDELTQRTSPGTMDDLARRPASAKATAVRRSFSEGGSAGAEAANSIAILVQHIAGNLRSRFTNFLTSDGEKPWRDRDREFEDRPTSRADLDAAWQDGWQALFSALSELADDDLGRAIVIRGQSFRVDEALLRSVAHASYHVGQIVYVAKAFCGDAWKTLSIPKGASAAFNAAPTGQRPTEHATKIDERVRRA